METVKPSPVTVCQEPEGVDEGVEEGVVRGVVCGDTPGVAPPLTPGPPEVRLERKTIRPTPMIKTPSPNRTHGRGLRFCA
jgi:hypothetical protein